MLMFELYLGVHFTQLKFDLFFKSSFKNLWIVLRYAFYELFHLVYNKNFVHDLKIFNNKLFHNFIQIFNVLWKQVEQKKKMLRLSFIRENVSIKKCVSIIISFKVFLLRAGNFMSPSGPSIHPPFLNSRYHSFMTI